MLRRATLDWYGRLYLPQGRATSIPADDPRVSPIFAADHTELAPALIIAASEDPLRDDATRYAAVLSAAGVPVELRMYESAIHGFLSIPLFEPAAAAGRGRDGGLPRLSRPARSGNECASETTGARRLRARGLGSEGGVRGCTGCYPVPAPGVRACPVSTRQPIGLDRGMTSSPAATVQASWSVRHKVLTSLGLLALLLLLVATRIDAPDGLETAVAGAPSPETSPVAADPSAGPVAGTAPDHPTRRPYAPTARPGPTREPGPLPRPVSTGR